MGKPGFKLRVRKQIFPVSGKPNSKAEAIVRRKNINKKETQIEEAVNWCKANGKKAHSALKTGMFPLIKDRGTIDRRLVGKNIKTKKEHLRILTVDEERSIVEYIKNKNRCHQGVSRKEVTALIVDVLQIRQHCNSKIRGGRKFVKLSQNAKRVIETHK